MLYITTFCKAPLHEPIASPVSFDLARLSFLSELFCFNEFLYFPFKDENNAFCSHVIKGLLFCVSRRMLNVAEYLKVLCGSGICKI